jgi:chaperonin cofactor prefoldin
MNNRTLSRIDDILFGLRSIRSFTDRVRIFTVLPDVLAGNQLSETLVSNIHSCIGKIDESELRTCTVTNSVNGTQQTQMVHTITCIGLLGLVAELNKIAMRGKLASPANGNFTAAVLLEIANLVDVLNQVVKKVRSVESQMQNAHNECQGVQQDLFEAEARKQVAALRLDEALLHHRASKARFERVEEDVKLVRLVHSLFSEFDNQKKVVQSVKEMLASIAHYASSTVALDSVDTRRELHDAVLDNGDECAPFPVDCHVEDDSMSGSSSGSGSSSRSDMSSSNHVSADPDAVAPHPIRRTCSADEILLVRTRDESAEA